MQELAVGDVVHWFQNNRPDARPLPGLILEVCDHDVLMMLQYTAEGTPVFRGCVHHRDSVSLKRAPSMMAQYGCWDYKKPKAKPVSVSQPEAKPEVKKPETLLTEEPPFEGGKKESKKQSA